MPLNTNNITRGVQTPAYAERDLSSETPRGDENSGSNSPASTPLKSIRRSFSWGKKKKRAREKKKEAAAAAAAANAEPLNTECVAITLSREMADTQLGLEMHIVTGDVFVSYVGPDVVGVSVGDTILSVHGQEVFHPAEDDGLDSDLDNLDFARHLLREPAEEVELTIEKNSLRTEVLKRHAALRGTSLDKLGLVLCNYDGAIMVQEMEGLAAKSGRIVSGDRLVSINGSACSTLEGAVELIAAGSEDLEVVLEFVYGYLPPADHDFDPASGTYIPTAAPKKGPGLVRRSLSFGKKKRAAEKPKRRPAAVLEAEAMEAAEAIPELDTEVRMLSIAKNDEGRICVTFKIHEVTGELMIGLVGEGSPAALAGVEVGDRVLALGSKAAGCEFFDEGGQADFERARAVLAACSNDPVLEMAVQTRIRTEIVEFGYAPDGLGGPKTHLGLSFYSLEGDQFVRITKISGAAAKSGRLALGDRVVAMNGIRVNYAESLSDHIVNASKLGAPAVELEVALGYAAAEGVWYGQEAQTAKEGEAPRKPKRSFSFGRKPRH